MAFMSVRTPHLEISNILFLPSSLVLSSVLIFFDISGALDTEDDCIHPCNTHSLMSHCV